MLDSTPVLCIEVGQSILFIGHWPKPTKSLKKAKNKTRNIEFADRFKEDEIKTTFYIC